MSNKWGIKPEQAEVLMELEKIIGETIDQSGTVGGLFSHYASIKEEKIVELGLFRSVLTSLPKSIGNLTSLQSLYLEDLLLTTLPESIGNLQLLQKLSLKGNKLTTLPESIGNLQLLQELDLEGSKLTKLPESMGNLQSLQLLNLMGNKLTTLPESIGNLQLLQELNLIHNRLTSLSESIGNLHSLQKLNLLRNELTTLPESITKLESLQELDLEGNQLIVFPDSITKLISLQTLNLSYNKLTTLPESIAKLTSLQTLNLSFIKSITLPESIAKLTSLQTLNLRGNQRTSLPESIGNLKSLQDLNLMYNRLTTLPEPITKLTSLQTLNLSYNDLTTLPESISNLQSLQTLDLRSNYLEWLPGSMWQLRNLRILELNSNRWEVEWEEIVKRDIPAIREFCRQRASINIFLSHAVVDFETFYIKEISDYLDKQNEIYKVFYCEEDLTGNIDDFMNEKLPQCQLILFFASKKSVFNSEDCKHELELARKHNIQIIPIKGPDVKWEELKERALSRELGYEFKVEDFKIFREKLYEYIKKFKRDINVFEPEQAKIDRERLNFKTSFINIIESEGFKEIFEDNWIQFAELFQDLSSDRIPPNEYLFKGAQLIHKNK